MPTVWIPPLLRDLTGGRHTVVIEGATVGQVVTELDLVYPGIRDRLVEGDSLDPAIAVAVDREIARLGLDEPVAPEAEVHFLPAIGGG